jgi:hypothetical protein
MSFVKVEKLLKKSVKAAGLTDQLAGSTILAAFDQVMSDFFGRGILNKIKPLSIQKGVLTIACLSSILAENLKVKEKLIIFRLNQVVGKKVIIKIKYSV